MNFFATTMIAHKTRTVLNILGLIALISMGIACGAEPLLANEDKTKTKTETETETETETYSRKGNRYEGAENKQEAQIRNAEFKTCITQRR